MCSKETPLYSSPGPLCQLSPQCLPLPPILSLSVSFSFYSSQHLHAEPLFHVDYITTELITHTYTQSQSVTLFYKYTWGYLQLTRDRVFASFEEELKYCSNLKNRSPVGLVVFFFSNLFIAFFAQVYKHIKQKVHVLWVCENQTRSAHSPPTTHPTAP